VTTTTATGASGTFVPPSKRPASLARPYDLRHSFVTLMLHEGRVGIVDLASQLGHSPTMTLNTYGHVIAELREAPKRSAAEQIYAARDSDPKTLPQPKNGTSREPEDRVAEGEPTSGFEPLTPSLRVKCSTS
jgi:hypothetical protein